MLLVAGTSPGRVRYRPRSEDLFHRVEHISDRSGDVWEVRSRDGLVTTYGTLRPRNAPPDWRDPAVIADPRDRRRIFEWRVTQIQDPTGRVVTYEYLRNRNEEPGRADEPLLRRISHADYGDRANPAFTITVELDHERHPAPSSHRRAGFEVRTTMRCRTIGVVTHGADGRGRLAGAYRLRYDDEHDAGTPIHMEVATTDEVGERRSA